MFEIISKILDKLELPKEEKLRDELISNSLVKLASDSLVKLASDSLNILS